MFSFAESKGKVWSQGLLSCSVNWLSQSTSLKMTLLGVAWTSGCFKKILMNLRSNCDVIRKQMSHVYYFYQH
jgi:hypothetical protein